MGSNLYDLMKKQIEIIGEDLICAAKEERLYSIYEYGVLTIFNIDERILNLSFENLDYLESLKIGAQKSSKHKIVDLMHNGDQLKIRYEEVA